MKWLVLVVVGFFLCRWVYKDYQEFKRWIEDR